MAAGGLTRPGLPRRWRKPAMVAASVGLHGLVLGYLALTTVGVAIVSPDLPRLFIPLQLEPRPLLPGERVRVPTPPPPRTTTAVRTAPATATATRRKPEEDEAPPTPPIPRLALPAPGAPVIDDAWQLRPRLPGAVGNLRAGSLGCRLGRSRLTPAEQTACDDRFGAAALSAAPVTGSGNPARDAQFAAEGARALAAYERRRRPLAGGTGVVGPQDGPGSNFGMGVAGALLDPSLRPDSTENIRTNRRDGPRE